MRQGAVIGGALAAAAVAIGVTAWTAGRGSPGLGDAIPPAPSPATPPPDLPERPPPPPLPATELERLVQAVRDARDPAERERAVHAVSLQGPSARAATPALIELGERESVAAIRAKIAWSLGQLRDVGAAPALQRWALSDPEPAVRVQAARAIARCGGLDEAATLGAIDLEPDGAVRGAWISVLSDCPGDAATTRLRDLGRRDPAPGVRQAALGGLARRPFAEGDPTWEVLRHGLGADADGTVRQAAAAALIAHGGEAGRTLVRAARESDPDPATREVLGMLLQSSEPGATPDSEARER